MCLFYQSCFSGRKNIFKHLQVIHLSIFLIVHLVLLPHCSDEEEPLHTVPPPSLETSQTSVIDDVFTLQDTPRVASARSDVSTRSVVNVAPALGLLRDAQPSSASTSRAEQSVVGSFEMTSPRRNSIEIQLFAHNMGFLNMRGGWPQHDTYSFITKKRAAPLRPRVQPNISLNRVEFDSRRSKRG